MRVIKLASLELRRYRRGKLGRAAVVAMILLPLLYGTVYLVAFWNPYNNLDRTPAVIVNEDVPATTSQGQQINAGAELEQQLLASKSFTWSVEDAETANRGLDDGSYFYKLQIPKDFSASIATLGTTEPKLAEFTLVTNEANSYLTSLIGEDVSSKLQSAVSQGVIQQFIETTLTGIQTIRSNLETGSDGAAELAAGTKKAKAGSRQLASGAAQVAAGNE